MSGNNKETVEICILLAAYNGERFIAEQIESLLSQTHKNWRLFIRDDGSSDGTITIINGYAQKDKRINIVKDEGKNLGSCQNFARLLKFTSGQFYYTMFCDQDDYWLPDKIGKTLSQMKCFEKKHGQENPLLVYTNFIYADNNLKEIESMRNFQATKVSNLSFAHLLAQNPAYGCTMMMNKSLTQIVGDIPVQAENHDYWVALVASALGKICYSNNQTILYRQHNNNISTNYDSNSLTKRFKRIFLKRENFEDVHRKIQMAIVFKAAYFDSLSCVYKKILNDYIKLFKHKSISLFLTNLRNGVRRQTISQTILFYISILLLRKEIVVDIKGFRVLKVL